MARPRRQPRERWSTGRRVWIAVGVVAFLALDVVLVGLALNASREVESNTEYIVPTENAQPSTTPTPTQPPVIALPVTRVLAGAGESLVWRAEAGSCSAGVAPLLQTSSDAGATWVDRNLSRYDVRQVLALSVRDASYGEAVVRTGDDCELVGIRSFTGGQFWEESGDILPTHSFLDLDNPGTVVVAGEGVPAPCADAAHAVPAEETVLTLCGDGSVFAWDSGDWAPRPAQASAVALVMNAVPAEMVFMGPPECPFAVGARSDGGELSQRLCATTPAIAGSTLAAQVDGRTWVWSGDFFATL